MTIYSKFRKLVFVSSITTAFLCALGAAANQTDDASLISIDNRAINPVIMVCDGSSTSREMADYLSAYLKKRNIAVASDFIDKPRKKYNGTLFVLATSETIASLEPDAKFVFDANDTEQTYIFSAQKNAKWQTIYLIGKDSAGIRAAVSRFICALSYDGTRITLRQGVEKTVPFIGIRMPNIGPTSRRQVPPGSPFRDTDFEEWPAELIKSYVECFWQMGFNGIHMAEVQGYGSGACEEERKPYRTANIRRALLTLADAAKQRDMFVTLFVWGDTFFNEGQPLCFNDNFQRTVMEYCIQELAYIYASHIDNLFVHIGDPGGCMLNGCQPYKTNQQITAVWMKYFRAINPAMQGSLNTWANSPFWSYSPVPVSLDNYSGCFTVKDKKFGLPIPDGAKFLDSTFMPSDIGIALHREYNKEQAEAIVQSGRPVDVWTWYVCDMEMNNNTWILPHMAEQVFSRLTDEAHRYVRSHTVDVCFHGWPSIIGAYVGVQKLINPHRCLTDIEKEFCTAAFGPANTDAALALYRACYSSLSFYDCTFKFTAIDMTGQFGTELYNEELENTIEDAEKISFPENWTPNFTFPVPVQKYIEMLKARARLTLAVSEAKYAVDKVKNESTTDKQTQSRLIEKIKKDAVDSLPNLPIDPLFKQDTTIVRNGYQMATFKELIEAL